MGMWGPRPVPGPQSEDCGSSVSSDLCGAPPTPLLDRDLTLDRRIPATTPAWRPTLKGDPPMTTETQPNGVNATAVVDFAQQLQADAPPNGTPFRAEVRWRGGFRNEIRVRDLPPTYADEPTLLGGTNTAANPVEQVLGALGSCLAIGYTAGAVARGITIDDLRIELEGNIDLPVFFGLADGHAGYERVDARVYLTSDAPAEVLEALHADVIRTSPVGNTLERPAALLVRIVDGAAA